MGAEASNLIEVPKQALSNCRIVVVGPKNGDPSLMELSNLPLEARILATGCNIDEIRRDGDTFTEGNVLLNISGNGSVLGPIIDEMPFLKWVHSSHAGIEHIICPELLRDEDLIVTNAKGVFSQSLGEYVIAACLYFAKSFKRLETQRQEKSWEKFNMELMPGKVMGIIGYGDIGRACAKYAKAFGMTVLALRRNPSQSEGDPLVDKLYGMDSINEVMAQSDYLVTALPLTPQTKGIFNTEVFSHSKLNQVFINVGRGGLVVDDDLIFALGVDGPLLGAALDVFNVEPLTADSAYWNLSNVLISPHNADQTVDFRNRSVKFFTENCKRFISGQDLESIVNVKEGY